MNSSFSEMVDWTNRQKTPKKKKSPKKKKTPKRNSKSRKSSKGTRKSSKRNSNTSQNQQNTYTRIPQILPDIEYMRAYETRSLQPGYTDENRINRLSNTDEYNRRVRRVSRRVLGRLQRNHCKLPRTAISQMAFGAKNSSAGIFTRKHVPEPLSLNDVYNIINNIPNANPEYPSGRRKWRNTTRKKSSSRK